MSARIYIFWLIQVTKVYDASAYQDFDWQMCLLGSGVSLFEKSFQSLALTGQTGIWTPLPIMASEASVRKFLTDASKPTYDGV